MDADAAAPSDRVLRWAAAAISGASVTSADSLSSSRHRPSGSFRLTVEGTPSGTTDVVLKVSVPRWITDGMVVTNARALGLAAVHGLATPRLIAGDFDGSACGTVATLETLLPGSSRLPPTLSTARLRAAGAAIAKVHAVKQQPQPHLRYRPRPCAVDDCAAERRRGFMPSTPLLEQADTQVRSYKAKVGSVFLHGDVWAGNILWEQGRCAALVDWKTAGVGNPGVDLGGLRMQMALQYGLVAASHVLEGWQQHAGLAATDVPYWDAIAALNTPTVMNGWSGFADDGEALDTSAVTERRDAFLRNALEQFPK